MGHFRHLLAALVIDLYVAERGGVGGLLLHGVLHPLDDRGQQVLVEVAHRQDQAEAFVGEGGYGVDEVAAVRCLVGGLVEVLVGHEGADAAAYLQVVDVVVFGAEQHEHEADLHLDLDHVVDHLALVQPDEAHYWTVEKVNNSDHYSACFSVFGHS